jgi:hemolysin III
MKMYCEGRTKPIFRGFFHLIGLMVLVPLWVNEILPHINEHHEQVALTSLVIGSVICWGASALFHTIPWSLKEEIRWQKFDHAAIFLKIAFMYTPFAFLAIGRGHALWMDTVLYASIVFTWVGAFAGVYHVHYLKGERVIYHALLIISTFPCYYIISEYLTIAERTIAILGLISYPLGTFIFVKKYLNHFKYIFGYHEIFHLFTVFSSWMAFTLMYSLVSDLDSRCELAERLYQVPGMSFATYVLTNSISCPNDICNNYQHMKI